ncbi:helix-turn-helix domain-containing protein [Gordonia sp. NPDC003504]
MWVSAMRAGGNWSAWYDGLCNVNLVSRPRREEDGEEATTTLDDLRARRPGNRERIDRVRAQMNHDTAIYRLVQLRRDAGLVQKEVADIVGVGQNRVSRIEKGDLATTTGSTLQKYVEALGSELELMVKKARRDRGSAGHQPRDDACVARGPSATQWVGRPGSDVRGGHASTSASATESQRTQSDAGHG